MPLAHIVAGRAHGSPTDAMVWTDRGDANAGGNTLNRATVQPAVGQRQVVSSGYDEAISVTAASLSVFYVSDLGGTIRHVDLHHGIDTDLTHLGRGLTGGTMSRLNRVVCS